MKESGSKRPEHRSPEVILRALLFLAIRQQPCGTARLFGLKLFRHKLRSELSDALTWLLANSHIYCTNGIWWANAKSDSVSFL